jgi:hypothetical protein
MFEMTAVDPSRWIGAINGRGAALISAAFTYVQDHFEELRTTNFYKRDSLLFRIVEAGKTELRVPALDMLAEGEDGVHNIAVFTAECAGNVPT